MASHNKSVLNTSALQAIGGSMTATTIALLAQSPITTPVSQSHTITTTMTPPGEAAKNLMLWIIFIIALSALLVLVMSMGVVVAVCHRVRKKRRRHYVHQTKPRQGSQRSVQYSIKSQDGVHLGNPHYEYVDVLEEDYEDTVVNEHLAVSASPQKYLTPRASKRVVHGESTLYDNLEPQAGTEQTASSSRVAVPPFITIRHHDSATQPGDSETDTRQSSNLQTETEETTPNAEGAGTAEENKTTSQTQTPESDSHHLDNSTAFEDGTMLGNVPMFEDPEIGESLRVPTPPNIYSSQILATATDSQGTEGDSQQDNVNSAEPVSLICTDTEPPSEERNTPLLLSTSIQKSESLHFNDPEYMDINTLQYSKDTFDNTDQRPAPEGAAQFNQDSLNRSTLIDKEIGEVVYDEPVITKHEDKESTNEHSNLATLFDDPRYTEVVLKTQQDEPKQQNELVPIRKHSWTKDTSRPQTLTFEQPIVPHRVLWSSMSQDGGSYGDRLLTKKSGLQYSNDDTSLPDKSKSTKLQQRSNLKPLEVQVAAQKSHKMKSSIDSLELLNFQDEEIEELDPEIAICLQRTPDSSRRGLKVTQV